MFRTLIMVLAGLILTDSAPLSNELEPPVRLEAAGKPIDTTEIGHAAPFVCDFNGDYDLIIGTVTGNVYLVQNEGTPESYVFGREKYIQAGGQAIDVERNAAPFTADWDGDGDLDLLVGADDGSASLYQNTGTTKSSELASAVQLVPPVEKIPYQHPPREVRVEAAQGYVLQIGTKTAFSICSWVI